MTFCGWKLFSKNIKKSQNHHENDHSKIETTIDIGNNNGEYCDEVISASVSGLSTSINPPQHLKKQDYNDGVAAGTVSDDDKTDKNNFLLMISTTTTSTSSCSKTTISSLNNKPNKLQKLLPYKFFKKLQYSNEKNKNNNKSNTVPPDVAAAAASGVALSVENNFKEEDFDELELELLAISKSEIIPTTTIKNLLTNRNSNTEHSNIHDDDDKNVAIEDGNPRNKCALKPGHSLMDWVRLGNSGIDLTGTKGQIIPITITELKKHNQINDAWIAIRGKVFNVTKYMDFHPGGCDELVKGIGQDATKMFNDIHAWVNYEQLLSKCFIGPLCNNTILIDLEPIKPRQKSTTPTPNSINQHTNTKQIHINYDNENDNNDFEFQPPKLPIRLSNSEKTSPINTFHQNQIQEFTTSNNSQQDQEVEQQIIPRFDWLQKTTELILIFYTKPYCNPGIIILHDLQQLENILIEIWINNCKNLYEFQLNTNYNWPPYQIRLAKETGKIEIILIKTIPQLWTAYGIMKRKIHYFNNNIINDQIDLQDKKINIDINCDVNIYNFIIENCQHINHDSYAITFQSENHTNLIITPIGYHVSITAIIDGETVTRSYTPIPNHYMPFECLSTNISILIKTYTNGRLSKYLTNLDVINMKNIIQISIPKGNFQLRKLLQHTKIGLIAAGSGITPILSVLDHLLARINNKIEHIELMLFNKTIEDIWCRDKLETIQTNDKRLVIRHILSDYVPNEEDNWNGDIGRINENLLKPLRDKNTNQYVTYCCVCGPTQFNDIALKLLLDIGFIENDLHFFQG